MATLRHQLAQVMATIALFMSMLAVNDWLFTRLESAPVINWIYLPAGMRLLCTLLTGLSLAASWPAQLRHLVYLGARRHYRLQSSLRGLTGTLIVLYGLKAALSLLPEPAR